MKRIVIPTIVGLLLSAGTSTQAGVTGQWEFNVDLSASIGTALQPQGIATSQSAFGTTASFGISDIGGQAAQVMRFPAMPSSADGYKIFPGAAANGSTTDVNRYTLVMDILYPASSGGYRGLFQTSDGNANDADWFVNGSNGIGINGDYSGNLTSDAWHRIALVVDLEQTDVTKKFLNYIDGAFVGYSDLGGEGAPGGRYSVWPASSGNASWLLSDNDGETALGYVNSVQFSDYAMSAAEIAFLGGPSAAGIPTVPEPASGLILAASMILLAMRAWRRQQ